MHLRILIRTLMLALAFGLVGCKGKSPVIASVYGHDVRQNEFDAYLKLKHIAANDPKRRDRALDEYLDRTGMAAVLEKEGQLDRAAIEAEVAEFRKEIVLNRYFDHFLDEKVNEAAIKSYYDAHASQYEQRKVHVAHILVRTNPKLTEEERQAKRTTAQEIYSKLQTGQSFEELAKTLSDDHISGAKGGDLGWLREGAIDPEFSKRAFEQKVGTVSEPFETPFGFHLLKVIEEPKVARKPFAAAMGDIRYQLRAEAKEAEIKRLKEKAKIKKKGATEEKAPATPSASAAPAVSAPKLLAAPDRPMEPILGQIQPHPLSSALPPLPPEPPRPPVAAETKPPPNGKGATMKAAPPKPPAVPPKPPAATPPAAKRPAAPARPGAAPNPDNPY